nr:MAG TPA: hypothetical protein [Caudoviricetes sp.]
MCPTYDIFCVFVSLNEFYVPRFSACWLNRL